jgi:hypothetical protein
VKAAAPIVDSFGFRARYRGPQDGWLDRTLTFRKTKKAL